MSDIYIHRMSLIAMQAFQLHEDIKELLQHYHADALVGAGPGTSGIRTDSVVANANECDRKVD